MLLALMIPALGCGDEQESAPAAPPIESTPPPAPPDDSAQDPAANLPTDPSGVESAIAEHVGNGAGSDAAPGEAGFGVDDPRELLPSPPAADAGVAQVARADALLQELKNHTRNKDFRAADQVYADLAPMMATLPEPMQKEVTDAYDALVATRRQQAIDEGLLPVIPDDAELTK